MSFRSPSAAPALAFVMLLGLVAPATGPVAAQPSEPPLPALDDLLPELRDALRANAELFGRYRFRQRITSRERDRDGTVTKTTVREYEVTPNAWGAPAEWLLLRVNGKGLPRSRIEAHREKQRRRRSGSPDRLAHLRRKAAERQQEVEEAIDEVFRIVDARVTGRVQRDGRSTIEIAFAPRSDVDARTPIGKVFRKTEGHVWINEADRQLVRFEGEATDTILYGLGLVARVHPGTRLEFDRRLVDGDAWLPASYHLRGSARLLLFKVDRFDHRSDFFGYARVDGRATVASR